MSNVFDIINKALKDSPVNNDKFYNLNDICANIVDGIDLQVAEHNESAFERFTNELNFDDEIAELKEFCSPAELVLFLSDIG